MHRKFMIQYIFDLQSKIFMYAQNQVIFLQIQNLVYHQIFLKIGQTYHFKDSTLVS